MPQVDFLPAAYRQRAQRRALGRQRLLLVLLVTVALVLVDGLFRQRIAGLQGMQQHAQDRLAQLQSRVADNESRRELLLQAQQALASSIAQLGGPRLVQVLDHLLVERPRAIRFRELQYRSAAAPDDTPWLQLDVRCNDLAVFPDYLQALAASEVLPPLRFNRSDRQRDGEGQEFRLESLREEQR